MDYALEVKELKKHYPGTQALKGITLQIKNNSFLALLGKNGAGKSTFIGILSSLIKKTSGKVSVLGYDLEKNSTIVKSLIGIVPQEINLPVFDKVINVLINQAGYYGVDRKTATERAKKYLSILGLSSKKNAQCISLSGGMKRRVMIARALIHDPRIIFLDEPTAGVDVEIRAIIWDFLRTLQKEGKTIILTTHYLEEAEALCDTIAILNQGEITINGTMEDTLETVSKSTISIEVSPHKLEKKDFGKFSTNIKKISQKKIEIFFDKKENKLNKILEKLITLGVNIKNIKNLNSDLEKFLQD
ncbi:MAG: ABC transporter ATP-binding protein [Alphaproteobacteria bacterium]|nr:ABC transporter ATP-binding protein [Alphaproteobacteria bacterium]